MTNEIVVFFCQINKLTKLFESDEYRMVIHAHFHIYILLDLYYRL